MQILLSAINAKFIHPSLALYSIAAYSAAYGTAKDIKIQEFTINQHHEYIVSEIFRIKPDILCFSCYIWSIEHITAVCRTIRKILTNTRIILGGPEVSFEYDWLLENRICDVIVIGEGEATFSEILEYYRSDKGSLYDIDGIAFYDNGVITGKKRRELDLAMIPFPYANGIERFENRIIYYETSRGCPFSCGYCMSSLEAKVRYLPLHRVFAELKFFLEREVPLVKFTDRTFNCDKTRTAVIWNFLKENDNGISVFHFEIAADLLTNDLCEVLRTARKGLFQFEIGVQSTNVKTLEIINRKSDLPALFSAVKKLKSFSNINIHLDLIAGLPGEDFKSFEDSFNQVYTLKPDMLQLGFLKLLKGVPLRNEYGIIYDDSPPYTVLMTNDISYVQLQILRDIEILLDSYYNSCKAHYTLCFSTGEFKSPFDFYHKFSEYWRENHLHDLPHSRVKLCVILYEFLRGYMAEHMDFISDLLVFDMCKYENIKTFPYFVREKGDKNLIRSLYAKYVPKKSLRRHHIQPFDYDVDKWISGGFEVIEKSATYILFNYDKPSDMHLGVHWERLIL